MKSNSEGAVNSTIGAWLGSKNVAQTYKRVVSAAARSALFAALPSKHQTSRHACNSANCTRTRVRELSWKSVDTCARSAASSSPKSHRAKGVPPDPPPRGYSSGTHAMRRSASGAFVPRKSPVRITAAGSSDSATPAGQVSFAVRPRAYLIHILINKRSRCGCPCEAICQMGWCNTN